jgi:hypothetical protein
MKTNGLSSFIGIHMIQDELADILAPTKRE